MNFLFKLSISDKCYVSKDKADIKSMTFTRSSINSAQLVEKIKEGYAFCHWFIGNARIGVKQKCVSNFDRANVVFIDIDDCDIEMKSLVAMLPNKPTAYYTTMNNGKNGKFRYHLCYGFTDDIETPVTYKGLYNAIVLDITNSVPDYSQQDDCGGRCAQFMYGNGTGECEAYSTDYTYRLSDFGINPSVTEPKSDNLTTKIDNVENNALIPFTDIEFEHDLYILSPSDFIDKYRGKYAYYDRTDLMFQDGYALIPDDYQEIVRPRYWDIYTDDNGKEHRAYLIKKLRDGDKRRYCLYISCLIRRLIHPEVQLEQLLYNLVCDRQYYFDNSDKVLTNKLLLQIARNALSIPIDEIKFSTRPTTKKYVVDRVYCHQNGIKPRAMSNMVRRKLNEQAIGELYDANLSVADNVKLLNQHGIKVGKSTLYKFCKANGISRRHYIKVG